MNLRPLSAEELDQTKTVMEHEYSVSSEHSIVITPDSVCCQTPTCTRIAWYIANEGIRMCEHHARFFNESCPDLPLEILRYRLKLQFMDFLIAVAPDAQQSAAAQALLERFVDTCVN